MSISTAIVKTGGPERDGPISMAGDEEMMTDRSTKPLKCYRFIELLGLENIKERLELIRRYEGAFGKTRERGGFYSSG